MVEKKRKASQNSSDIEISRIRGTALVSPGWDKASHSHDHIDTHMDADSYAKNQKKLTYAMSICFSFFLIQLFGGYYTHSLALVADSFHLLTDCAAYAVSLFALYISQKKPTARFSYGFARAEVLGAMISVLLIWSLVFYLIDAAIDRLKNESAKIDGKNMFILALIGLIVNIILLVTLGHDHDHDHHSSHHSLNHAPPGAESPEDDIEAKSNLLDGENNTQEHKKHGNINIQAAILHALGDLLCSGGVFVASIIIMVNPEYQFVDPLSTFMFAFVVLITTGKIVRDIVIAMMQAAPVHVNPHKVNTALARIEGVVEVRELHISALTNEKMIVTARLVLGEKASSSVAARDQVLEKAQRIVKEEIDGVFSMTFQIEGK